jgi:hypothetical protein
VEHYSVDQVKEILREYNDIPGLILEQSALIENISRDTGAAEDIRNSEIQIYQKRIEELRKTRGWVYEALNMLDRTDRKILELAYVGPSDPRQRRGWRALKWKAIADEVNYSENWTSARAMHALSCISERMEKAKLSPQKPCKAEPS